MGAPAERAALVQDLLLHALARREHLALRPVECLQPRDLLAQPLLRLALHFAPHAALQQLHPRTKIRVERRRRHRLRELPIAERRRVAPERRRRVWARHAPAALPPHAQILARAVPHPGLHAWAAHKVPCAARRAVRATSVLITHHAVGGPLHCARMLLLLLRRRRRGGGDVRARALRVWLQVEHDASADAAGALQKAPVRGRALCEDVARRAGTLLHERVPPCEERRRLRARRAGRAAAGRAEQALAPLRVEPVKHLNRNVS